MITPIICYTIWLIDLCQCIAQLRDSTEGLNRTLDGASVYLQAVERNEVYSDHIKEIAAADGNSSIELEIKENDTQTEANMQETSQMIDMV